MRLIKGGEAVFARLMGPTRAEWLQRILSGKMRSKGNLLIRRALDEFQKFLTEGVILQSWCKGFISTEQCNSLSVTAILNQILDIKVLGLIEPQEICFILREPWHLRHQRLSDQSCLGFTILNFPKVVRIRI